LRVNHPKIFIITLVLVFSVAVVHGSEFDQEKTAVRQAALDYTEGAHSGDAARIERACHVEMNKVTVRKIPATGKEYVNRAGYTRMVERVRAGAVNLPENQRNIEVKVYAVREGLAAVRVRSAMFCDYLQLAKINDRWRIVNVLWKMNPEFTR